MNQHPVSLVHDRALVLGVFIEKHISNPVKNWLHFVKGGAMVWFVIDCTSPRGRVSARALQAKKNKNKTNTKKKKRIQSGGVFN